MYTDIIRIYHDGLVWIKSLSRGSLLFGITSLADIRDFNGHLPYLFQNPISNFYLSLEAGKSSTDSVILRKLTNVEIIFRAWTKSLKRTKLYFDD